MCSEGDAATTCCSFKARFERSRAKSMNVLTACSGVAVTVAARAGVIGAVFNEAALACWTAYPPEHRAYVGVATAPAHASRTAAHAMRHCFPASTASRPCVRSSGAHAVVWCAGARARGAFAALLPRSQVGQLPRRGLGLGFMVLAPVVAGEPARGASLQGACSPHARLNDLQEWRRCQAWLQTCSGVFFPFHIRQLRNAKIIILKSTRF